MENTKTTTLIWKIIIGIADVFSVFQMVSINREEMFSIQINNTWLIISCFLTLLLIGIFLYGKISHKLELLNNRLLALKRFRDFESKGQQKYNTMLLSVLEHIFTTAKIWKKGEPSELQKLEGKYLDELIEEKIAEYNKSFKDDKEYKREP